MKLKIIKVAQYSGLAKERILALNALGHQVTVIHQRPKNEIPGINEKFTFKERVFHKLGFPCDSFNTNQALLEALTTQSYQVLWIDKALILKSEILKKIKQQYPNMLCIWYSGDDMAQRHNQSHYFIKTLPYYDLIFTTKIKNIENKELETLGAKKVCYINPAYSKRLHYPQKISQIDFSKYQADVTFIGTFEKSRAMLLYYLAEQGIAVRVWGLSWQKFKVRHPNLLIENRPVYEEEYRKVIAASKINLCFLRKINHDRDTTRSFEIPACGGFMLAEDTDMHRHFFTQDKEAAFFPLDKHELLHQVKYYLSHPELRKKISQAGYQRCVNSGYDDYTQLNKMIVIIKKLKF